MVYATARKLRFTVFIAVVVAAGFSMSSCNSSASSPAPSPTAVISLTPSAQPLASLLPGSAVPAELAHQWFQYQRGSRLLLNGNSYAMSSPAGSASGNVVVNGTEIDFFNGNPCTIPPPGGVGRYAWRIAGGRLYLTALNADPCGRSDELPDAGGWSPTNSP